MQSHTTPAHVLRQSLSAPWLTGAAIWSIAAASGALNAWGWSVTSTGLVAGLLVTLAIASEVLGVRLAFAVERAAREPGLRFFLALPLLLGVVGFNAYSGHRALSSIEAARASDAARIEAQAEERARLTRTLARIERDRAAVPPLPRATGWRLQAAARARSEEIERLELERAATEARLGELPQVTASPAEPLDPAAIWAIVLLAEGLKAFGLFAVSARRPLLGAERVQSTPLPRTASPAPSPNAGRDLAMRRWHGA